MKAKVRESLSSSPTLRSIFLNSVFIAFSLHLAPVSLFLPLPFLALFASQAVWHPAPSLWRGTVAADNYTSCPVSALWCWTVISTSVSYMLELTNNSSRPVMLCSSKLKFVYLMFLCWFSDYLNNIGFHLLLHHWWVKYFKVQYSGTIFLINS